MPTTPNLALPLLAAAQAQKHVTHNEALLGIDALVQCAVLDKDLPSAPAGPLDGSRYIVGPSPTGAWAGQAGTIAVSQDGVWSFHVPRAGFLAFVLDESLLYFHDGTGWTPLTSALGAVQRLSRLGVGTDADALNPFSAKLNGALWTARTVTEGGTGDLRYTLSKETAGNTLSLLFQSGYSGRLELGLIGSDNPGLKVSPDGSTWRTAVSVDAATGGVDFLAGSTDLASAGTTDLGAAATRKVRITGSTPITSFGTGPHRERLVTFAGALTLTHNATSLILPGGASLTTAAGDTATATSDGAGNWTVRHYTSAASSPKSPTYVSTSAGQKRVALSLQNNATAANTAIAIELCPTDGLGVRAAQLGAVNADGLNTCEIFIATSYGDVPTERIRVTAGTIRPATDAGLALGLPSYRWSTVYAATGAINTSDAREKTAVADLSEAELAAGCDLAREIGTFRYLDSVAVKGLDHARVHVGLTVQRAVEIMEARGLDPFRYGFICRDSWEAGPAIPAGPAADEVLEGQGRLVTPGQAAVAGLPGRPAGERFGFRPDQLALFIARGQETRIAALEARLAR